MTEKWWWLSFRDRDQNKWLGGCWVQGVSAVGAIQKSHTLKLNPGGEVIAEALADGEEPPPEQIGRLLRKGDLELERIWR